MLHRYEQKMKNMTKPDLQKHAFHVACWLCVLPAKQALQNYNGLSVVALLKRYLSSLNKEEVGGGRLAGILPLVARKVEAALLHNAEGRQLLKWIAGGQAAKVSSSSDQLSSALQCPDESRAARLLQKAIQCWKNKELCSRESYVESLEWAQESSEVEQICGLLRRAVAALSLPRCMGDDPCMGALQEEPPNSRDLQARLRKVVLWCLERVDVADSQLAPVLRYLESLLHKFQELHESNKSVGGAKDWIRLRAEYANACLRAHTLKANSLHLSLVHGVASMDEQGRKSAKKVQLCQHGVQPHSCRQCSACPHGKARSRCLQCCSCPHGKLKQNCRQCSACTHGKLKRNCAQCCPCPHGKLKSQCLQCGSCPHGNLKSGCAKCKACVHGKTKQYCRHCSACVHGNAKASCLACHACPHGKRKRCCLQCSGCSHGKVASSCVLCCPCPHGKRKQDCAACSGCKHGKVKKNCLQCSACPHGVLKRWVKRRCPTCAQIDSSCSEGTSCGARTNLG